MLSLNHIKIEAATFSDNMEDSNRHKMTLCYNYNSKSTNSELSNVNFIYNYYQTNSILRTIRSFFSLIK